MSKLHQRKGRGENLENQVATSNEIIEEPVKNKKSIVGYLLEPVDNSSLIVFRILFGLLMFYECWTYYENGFRKFNLYYVKPQWMGKYYMFEWVTNDLIVPKENLHMILYLMMFNSISISLGLLYRLNTFIFAVCWTYLFLLDSLLYLNHFYLICMLSFILVVLPAHRNFSIDSLILFPSIRTDFMPRYILWLLRGEQVNYSTLVLKFSKHLE